MTQEDKELLLKDLCARLPYGVICHYDCAVPSVGKVISYDRLNGIVPIQDTIDFMVGIHGVNALFDNIKPYLRPISSMTEEERKYIVDKCAFTTMGPIGGNFGLVMPVIAAEWLTDFYNSHYLDYRGLIEKGLAIEAPKGMYNRINHD